MQALAAILSIVLSTASRGPIDFWRPWDILPNTVDNREAVSVPGAVDSVQNISGGDVNNPGAPKASAERKIHRSRVTLPAEPLIVPPVHWEQGIRGLELTEEAIALVLAHPEWSISEFMSAYPNLPSAPWNRVEHILAFRRFDVRLADQIVIDHLRHPDGQPPSRVANRITQSFLRRSVILAGSRGQIELFRKFCLEADCRATTSQILLDNGESVEVYWIPGNLFAQMVKDGGAEFFANRRWQTSPRH